MKKRSRRYRGQVCSGSRKAMGAVSRRGGGAWRVKGPKRGRCGSYDDHHLQRNVVTPTGRGYVSSAEDAVALT